MTPLRLQAVAAVLALLAAGCCCRSFEFHEATIDAIQLGFKNGSLTSTALVRFYLDQITRLNPFLHAVIEVNPDARADADRRSGRHQAAGLHGIPVLLKDTLFLNTLNTTQHGAVVMENLEIVNLSVIQDPTKNGLLTALAAEFKLNLNNYLSDLSYSPVRSLADIIAFNNAHPVVEKLEQYGQSLLLLSQNTTGIGSAEKAAIQQLGELSANGVEKLMKEHRLDAIVTPDADAAVVLAFNGLPGIAVPAGYDEAGVPFGVCLGGLQGYEPRLIQMAYAFDRAGYQSSEASNFEAIETTS